MIGYHVYRLTCADRAAASVTAGELRSRGWKAVASSDDGAAIVIVQTFKPWMLDGLDGVWGVRRTCPCQLDDGASRYDFDRTRSAEWAGKECRIDGYPTDRTFIIRDVAFPCELSEPGRHPMAFMRQDVDPPYAGGVSCWLERVQLVA